MLLIVERPYFAVGIIVIRFSRGLDGDMHDSELKFASVFRFGMHN
jgi:hypothetical protein